MLKDFSFTSQFPVTVSAQLPGGGSLKFDGTAGPIDTADTSLTPVEAKVELTRLDLSQSALVNPQLGLAGSADFEGTVNSDGYTAKANGTMKAKGLKLVPKGSPSSETVQVVFALNHDLRNETGQLTATSRSARPCEAHRHLRDAERNHNHPHEARRPVHAGR